MRLIPLITALLVTAVLYLAVFQRDAMLAFALGEAGAEQSGGTGADAGATPVAPAAVDAVGVVVLRSQARTVDSAVILRGQTQAARQVEVRAETAATVISEPQRKGAFVQEGALLCKLDPGTRDAALAETRARLAEAQSGVPAAQARLDEARARLSEAEINFKAAGKLIRDGYASQTRLAATEAAVRSAEAAVAAAETGLKSNEAGIEAASAAVAAAEREIARLEIVAPFAGLLESDAAELGSLMQPGSLCATVIQLDPVKLVGYVPETEVDRVQVGARAGALLVSGRRVAGEVTFLSRSADPTTRTFEVEITVPNPDLAIRDGQTAEIAVSAEGVLAHLLPQSALTLNNEGALGVRIVDAGDIVQFVSVDVLRDTKDGVWTAGLPEKADVIVVGQDFVTQGVRVAPTYREAAK
ncbi:MAG: efflux RND transporter periplasmic adaptor subunit [Jhaorihella sp.]